MIRTRTPCVCVKLFVPFWFQIFVLTIIRAEWNKTLYSNSYSLPRCRDLLSCSRTKREKWRRTERLNIRTWRCWKETRSATLRITPPASALLPGQKATPPPTSHYHWNHPRPPKPPTLTTFLSAATSSQASPTSAATPPARAMTQKTLIWTRRLMRAPDRFRIKKK